MILSIDLLAPSGLPSFQRVQAAFEYAKEMELDKGFDDIHVRFTGKEYALSEPLKKIVFIASYESTFVDDTLDNLCLLRVILEIKEGKLFGCFSISDPIQNDKNIASSELLPYSEFVPLLERAKVIGNLHRDIRANWYTFKGWEDILPHVKHLSPSPTPQVS